ncbi:MAG: ribose-phosphate pyrophosphokinase [Bacteroidetes bacterium]|nr:MAG: ribose-phosphate pyrophosphokinase [Bacteroidota bacterium]
MSPQVKIFSGSQSKYLAEKISDFFGSPLGEVELLKFSDGELQVHYKESIRGSDIFIVQSTFAPADNMMELLLMIDAASRASANQVVVVMPYYGYARQDRKSIARVSIGAKLVANLLVAAGANRIVTMDLHAGQIQGFFDIPLDHLDATAVFVPYLMGLQLEPLCIASPDIGGSARARKYAKFINAELIIVDKHRSRPNEVESMQVIGDAKGKHIVLVDDLVDTAGTICKAADLLMEEGALSVRAIATHPILSGPAMERIEKSKLQELVVTDTIPLKNKPDKVRVLSIAPVFAKAFRKIHNFESISSLFI